MLSFFRRQFNRVPAATRWWLRITGWALAGLTAGWLISFALPERYTSEATLHLVPAMVSQDLLPHDLLDFERLLDSGRTTALSRNVLITIVNNFDLYKSERRREPMDVVEEDFRKSVRIERSGDKLIRVAFTYPDGHLANKVTQDLVNRFISQNISARSNMASESVQFFKDQVDRLGKSWLQAIASVKATPATDPRYELLMLERDQNRKEYESMAQKLATVEILKDLASRGQDVRLELLDAASLPDEPDTPPWVIALIGLGCGLAVWLLTALWRVLRRTGALKPA
jgi:uncharacterized protein involved in exopolysaccharide biosynthesis